MSRGEVDLAWACFSESCFRRGGARSRGALREVLESCSEEDFPRVAGDFRRWWWSRNRSRSELRRQGAEVLDRCREAGIQLLPPDSPGYPVGLRRAGSPGWVLFARGEPRILSRRCLGVTGSRRVSDRARGWARRLGRLAARAGLTLVAGWDNACEEEALLGLGGAPGEGRGLVVAGYSLDQEVPAGTSAPTGALLRRGGCQLGAVPPGKGYWPGQYALRNQLLAALTDDLVLVQAPRGSGSLEAVRAALEFGGEIWVPEVLATPALGSGGLDLLREGAHPLRRPLEVIHPDPATLPREPTPLGMVEEAGALAPDALFARCSGLGMAGLRDLLRSGWLHWTGDGRLEAGFGPLSGPCGEASC